MPRPPSCDCGTCQKCKHRLYMRGWYQRMSPEERREWVAKRDPEKVKLNDRKRYRRDKPKRLAISKKNAEKPESKKRKREYQREWRHKHPEKIRAHKLVRRAIDRGDLVREPCPCGSVKSEAHHADYLKPLDVEWLCRACHSERHFPTEPF
jgi:hypothetical protein